MKRSLAVSMAAIAFALMLLPTSMHLQTSNAASLITVPRDYPNIQSAIDAANHGDTIKVLPGTYTEQLTISKSLTLIGSGAKATIIKAPATLQPGVLGIPFIIEISDGAKVSMKGFAINGPTTTSCGLGPTDGLIGINVQEDSTLNLDTAVMRGCTFAAIRVGFPSFLPGGPQVGHATITRTDIGDYRAIGIIAAASDSTLKVSRSKIVGVGAPEIAGPIGIDIVFGAMAQIEHNKVSGNICNNPLCGPDYSTEFQGFGISPVEAGSGSVISYNEVSNNDVGLGVIGNSGCCKIDHNILTNNRFFGVVVQDGEHMISNTKISGGNVGVLAAAFEVDTVATLNRVIIIGATTPTEELSEGATAEVVFSPRSVQTVQAATLTGNPISFVLPTPVYAELSYQGEVAGG